VGYGYDSLYRLTSETVTSGPNNKNDAIIYTYDAVGNRKTLISTLPPAGSNSYTYDSDDVRVYDKAFPKPGTSAPYRSLKPRFGVEISISGSVKTLSKSNRSSKVPASRDF